MTTASTTVTLSRIRSFRLLNIPSLENDAGGKRLSVRHGAVHVCRRPSEPHRGSRPSGCRQGARSGVLPRRVQVGRRSPLRLTTEARPCAQRPELRHRPDLFDPERPAPVCPTNLQYIGFNTNSSFFMTARYRQPFNYVVDRAFCRCAAARLPLRARCPSTRQARSLTAPQRVAGLQSGQGEKKNVRRPEDRGL